MISRTAVLATVAVAATALALWAGRAPAAEPPPEAPLSEADAYAQLAGVAAAHGASLPDDRSNYLRAGSLVAATSPLAHVNQLTEADLAAGALIHAVVVVGDPDGRIPDGAYVVRVQFAPGDTAGTATFLDANGTAAAQVSAWMRTRDEINAVFPDTYGEPPPIDPPPMIPNVSSVHYFPKLTFDCTGPGWGWRVVIYG